MKKLLLVLLSITIVVIAVAQENTSGTVTYEEIDKIEIQIDNISPEMAALIPKENTNKTVLYFNSNTSLYENHQGNSKEEPGELEGGMHIMVSRPENIVYNDLENKITTEQKEFMTRTFLIESEMENRDWKITGNQKKILDMPCIEATSGDGDDIIKAWFTPTIPVSTGPAKLAGLPGMILEMEADSGNRRIVALDISFQLDADKIKKPKKGKKVTQEKFEEIVAIKTKEMGIEGNPEGSKTVIMTISQ